MWEVENGEGIGEKWSWSSLLAELGPLVILPDDQDQADLQLYGPVGQRWGDPTAPCPVGSCKLGMFHTGPHTTDPPSHPYQEISAIMNPDADVTKQDLETRCTCRRPAQHLPSCPRYARMTGRSSPDPSDQG
jgi:hypothetical protein